MLCCALVLSATTVTPAAAQEQPPVPPPPPATAPSAEPASAAPGVPQPVAQPAPAKEPLPKVTEAQPSAAQSVDPETLRQRRREIKNMEGVLASAVRSAAQEIASEIQTPETGYFLLSGSLTARGFILEDYGVFFHVEIPGVAPSLVSRSVLQSLQERFGGPRPPQAQVTGSGTPAPAVADAAPNPDAVYVERVKNALMRAMIQYSKPLALRPDEWLTVAAGDGDEPMMPAVLSEKAIMVLRIRGRDIAEYLAERLSLDEVLKRVEVRKF
jgi:hypothetical protein